MDIYRSHDACMGSIGRSTYLFLRFQLLRVEAVEQQGQEQVQHHEITHHQSGQEYGETRGGVFLQRDEHGKRLVDIMHWLSKMKNTHLSLGSHAIPQRFDPFATQDPEDHHKRVEKVVEIPSATIECKLIQFPLKSSLQTPHSPRHRIRIKLIRRVVLREQLHANHRENIDHNHQDQRQIPERPDRRDDDAQQHLHRRPRLRQLQHAQQSQPAQHAQPIDQLKNDVHQARRHDDQIEDVPAAQEVVLRQRHQLDDALEREHRCEHLVADVQSASDALAHAVVLERQEQRI